VSRRRLPRVLHKRPATADRWERRVTLCWTNWTIGVWWSPHLNARGLDLGPIEVVWRARWRGLAGERSKLV